MKTILSLVMLTFLCTPAFAAMQFLGKPFDNFSTSSTSLQSSTYINVKNYRTKTVTITGRYVKGGPFGNYSGTVTVNGCTGSDSTAYCTTADTATGTALTFTAPGNYSWSDAFPYIRVDYTKKKHPIDVWIYGVQY